MCVENQELQYISSGAKTTISANTNVYCLTNSQRLHRKPALVDVPLCVSVQPSWQLSIPAKCLAHKPDNSSARSKLSLKESLSLRPALVPRVQT